METSSPTGTGSYTLLGAVVGCQSFSIIGNGNSCYYYAEEYSPTTLQANGGWEEGRGTWATGGTLTRDAIKKSSNSNNPVSWTGLPLRVSVTFPTCRAEPELRTVTAATDAPTADDGIVLYNLVSNVCAVTMPLAAARGRNPFRVMKIDSSANAATFTRSGSDLINGAASLVLNVQFAAATFYSDGVSNFYVWYS